MLGSSAIPLVYGKTSSSLRVRMLVYRTFPTVRPPARSFSRNSEPVRNSGHDSQYWATDCSSGCESP